MGSARSLAVPRGWLLRAWSVLWVPPPRWAGQDRTGHVPILHHLQILLPLAAVMGAMEIPAWPSQWEMKRESQKRGWRSCCSPHTALPATEPARAPRPVLMPRRWLKHRPAQGHGARRFTVSTGHPGLHRADRGGHCQHPRTRTASPINHPTVQGLI